MSEDYGVIAPYPAERTETDEAYAVGAMSTANVPIHEHCPPDRLLVLVETESSGISTTKTHGSRQAEDVDGYDLEAVPGSSHQQSLPVYPLHFTTMIQIHVHRMLL